MADTAKILRDALALLKDGEAWTKYTYARDSDGQEVDELGAYAARFCIVGAICRTVGASDLSDQVAPAKEALRPCVPQGRVSRFNDDDSTTFDDIKRVFECAIAKAESP